LGHSGEKRDFRIVFQKKRGKGGKSKLEGGRRGNAQVFLILIAASREKKGRRGKRDDSGRSTRRVKFRTRTRFIRDSIKKFWYSFRAGKKRRGRGGGGVTGNIGGRSPLYFFCAATLSAIESLISGKKGGKKGD